MISLAKQSDAFSSKGHSFEEPGVVLDGLGTMHSDLREFGVQGLMHQFESEGGGDDQNGRLTGFRECVADGGGVGRQWAGRRLVVPERIFSMPALRRSRRPGSCGREPKRVWMAMR